MPVNPKSKSKPPPKLMALVPLNTHNLPVDAPFSSNASTKYSPIPVPAVVPAVVTVPLHPQSKKTAHSNPSKIFPRMKTFSGNL